MTISSNDKNDHLSNFFSLPFLSKWFSLDVLLILFFLFKKGNRQRVGMNSLFFFIRRLFCGLLWIVFRLNSLLAVERVLRLRFVFPHPNPTPTFLSLRSLVSFIEFFWSARFYIKCINLPLSVTRLCRLVYGMDSIKRKIRTLSNSDSAIQLLEFTEFNIFDLFQKISSLKNFNIKCYFHSNLFS